MVFHVTVVAKSSLKLCLLLAVVLIVVSSTANSNFVTSGAPSKHVAGDAAVQDATPSDTNRRLPFSLKSSSSSLLEETVHVHRRGRRRHLLRDDDTFSKSSRFLNLDKNRVSSLLSKRNFDNKEDHPNEASKQDKGGAPIGIRGSNMKRSGKDKRTVHSNISTGPFIKRKLQGGDFGGAIIPIRSIFTTSPEIQCWETAASLQFQGYQCTCTEAMTNDDSLASSGDMVLECNDYCGYCDLDGAVCGKDFFQQIFRQTAVGGGAGAISGDVGPSFTRSGPAGSKPKTISATSRLYSFQYVHGQDQLLQLEYTGCNFDLNNDGIFQLENIDETKVCSSCNVYVDGTKCSSCSLSVCGNDDGNDADFTAQVAPFIDCGNVDGVDSNIVYSLCDGEIDEFVEPGHPFYVFGGGGRNGNSEDSSVGFDVCFSPGRVQCEIDKNLQPIEGEDSSLCSCSDGFGVEGPSVLECNPNCGEFCHTDGDGEEMCGTKLFSTYYSSYDGSVQYTKETFQYKNARDNAKLELQVNDNNNSCSFMIDNAECDCMMQTCDADGKNSAPRIDCSSVLLSESDATNSIVSLCEESVAINDGLLEYLSSSKYGECVDTSPLNDQPICDLNNSEYVLDVGGSEVIDVSMTTTVQGSLGKSLQYPGAKSCTSTFAADIGSWFSIVGQGYGVTATTCGSSTNFDSQISVYSGGCDDSELFCVAGNDDDFSCGIQSTVTFFAEVDQVYHIRVHGYNFERGSFTLTVGPGNVLGPFCDEAKLTKEKEADTSSMSCECVPQGLITELSCVDECRYCNSERNVCTKRAESWMIEAGSPSASYPSKSVSHEYTSGSNIGARVVMETSDCNSDGGDCETCSVKVNDVSCTSCSTTFCVDGTIGFEIDCANVEATTTPFNTCDASVGNDSLLYVLTDDGFESCIRDSTEACTSLDFFDEETCSCVGTESGAALSCPDFGCILCNSDYSVCATKSIGATIDNDGRKIADVQSFQYIEGRDEVVTMEMMENSCKLLVNGNECNSCEHVTCKDAFVDEEYSGFKADCTNIETGATMSTCNGIAPQSGALQVFNEFEFDLCMDPETDVETVCQDLAVAQEQQSLRHEDHEGSIECTCERNVANLYTLTCIDTDCLHCNNEANVCATKGDGATLNKYGQFDSYLEIYQYVEGGRNDAVVMGSTLNAECFLEINGSRCNSCQEITCEDEFGYEYDSYVADCDNVESGLSYNGCDNVGLVDSSFESIGPLDVVFDHKFDVCLDVHADAGKSCLEKSAFYESWGVYSCECTGPDERGHFEVSCVDTSCLYCDEALKVCGRGLLSMDLNRFGNTYQDRLGFKYETGRTDEVYLGLGRAGNGCDVMVNGEECSMCQIAACDPDESGNSFWNHQIECDNVPGGANLDLCVENENIDGLFGYMSSKQYLECIKPTQEAADACNDADGLYETNNPGMSCECWNHVNSSTLMCDSPTCKFCNEDQSICGLEAYESIYSASGSVVSNVKAYQYTSGRTELVTVTTFGTSSDCAVAIDGMECAGCQEILCSDGTSDLKVDCSNLSFLGDGTVTYECGSGHVVFDFLTNPSFAECVSSLPDPVELATDAPVEPSGPAAPAGSAASLACLDVVKVVISLVTAVSLSVAM